MGFMSNMTRTAIHYFPLVKQLFRFGIVGLTAASIHFGAVVFLVQFFSLQPLIANVFAFAVSFQMGYWGHRLWTFHEATILHRVALPKLLLVQTAAFAANETLF